MVCGELRASAWLDTIRTEDSRITHCGEWITEFPDPKADWKTTTAVLKKWEITSVRAWQTVYLEYRNGLTTQSTEETAIQSVVHLFLAASFDSVVPVLVSRFMFRA